MVRITLGHPINHVHNPAKRVCVYQPFRDRVGIMGGHEMDPPPCERRVDEALEW